MPAFQGRFPFPLPLGESKISPVAWSPPSRVQLTQHEGAIKAREGQSVVLFQIPVDDLNDEVACGPPS